MAHYCYGSFGPLAQCSNSAESTYLVGMPTERPVPRTNYHGSIPSRLFFIEFLKPYTIYGALRPPLWALCGIPSFEPAPHVALT